MLRVIDPEIRRVHGWTDERQMHAAKCLPARSRWTPTKVQMGAGGSVTTHANTGWPYATLAVRMTTTPSTSSRNEASSGNGRIHE